MLRYTLFIPLLVKVAQAADFITVIDTYATYTTSNKLQVQIRYSVSADTRLQCNSKIFANEVKPDIYISSTSSERTLKQTASTLNAGLYTIKCVASNLQSNIGIIIVVAHPTLSICENTIPVLYSSSSMTMQMAMSGSGMSPGDKLKCTLCNKTVNHTVDQSKFYMIFNLSNCQESGDMKCNIGGKSVLSQKLFIRKAQLMIKKFFTDLNKNVQGSFIVATVPVSHVNITCDVYSASIINYEATLGSLTNDVLLTEAFDYMHVLTVAHTTSSGVYGVKCTADGLSDEQFFFDVVDSINSTRTGDGVKFSDVIIVPCSCDVTESFCNSQCCCDPDCSATQKESFSTCIGGPSGGDHSVKIAPNCSNLERANPWERALCFKINNSAFLGTYFNFVNESFMSEGLWDNTGIVGLPYQAFNKADSPIIIFSERTGTGLLALPGLIGRSCKAAVPLSLLHSTQVHCEVLNTECDIGSLLNVQSYLLPDSGVVEPCQSRQYKVYTKDFSNTEAIVRVFYLKDNTLINDQIADIVTSTDCTHAVTGVIYTVSVYGAQVVAVTANITLSDLSKADPGIISTTYQTIYTTNATTALLKTDNARGYEVYDKLAVLGGDITIPDYGDCTKADTTSPRFGVSSVAQCYLLLDDALISNCSNLYKTLLRQYRSYITNDSSVALTPFSTDNVKVYFDEKLDIKNVSTEEVCAHLPTALHIRLYSQNGTVSGSQITNVTYYYNNNQLVIDSGNRTMLYVYTEYLLSDTAPQHVDYTSLQAALFNTLLVVCAGLLYFTTPVFYRFNSKISSKK